MNFTDLLNPLVSTDNKYPDFHPLVILVSFHILTTYLFTSAVATLATSMLSFARSIISNNRMHFSNLISSY